MRRCGVISTLFAACLIIREWWKLMLIVLSPRVALIYDVPPLALWLMTVIGAVQIRAMLHARLT